MSNSNQHVKGVQIRGNKRKFQKNNKPNKNKKSKLNNDQFPQARHQVNNSNITSNESSSINNNALEIFPGMTLQLPSYMPNSHNDLRGETISNSTGANINEENLENEDDHLLSDEEETLSKGSIAIQGTNIVLDSPEDIQNWIKERKKNYPTDERIKEKHVLKQKESKILQNLSSFNNNRICKFFQTNGSCKNGDKCKFRHISTPLMKPLPNHKLKLVHGLPVQIPQRFTPLVSKNLHDQLIESDRLNNENIMLLALFEKIVRGSKMTVDWESYRKKLGYND